MCTENLISAKATRAVPRRGLSRRRKRGSERLSGARSGARCRYAARLLGALRDRRLLPDLADCLRGGPADAILQRVRVQGNDGVDGPASRREQGEILTAGQSDGQSHEPERGRGKAELEAAQQFVEREQDRWLGREQGGEDLMRRSQMEARAFRDSRDVSVADGAFAARIIAPDSSISLRQ